LTPTQEYVYKETQLHEQTNEGVNTMAKVRAQIMIDEEPKAIVQGYLAKTGGSFSGMVNALVCEVAKAIQGQPTKFDKPLGEMTVKELSDLLGYWIQKASE